MLYIWFGCLKVGESYLLGKIIVLLGLGIFCVDKVIYSL